MTPTGWWSARAPTPGRRARRSSRCPSGCSRRARSGSPNLARFTGKPALMALNGGAAAEAVEALTVDQQADRAVAMLRRVYGSRVPTPTAAQASNWWSDEFSRGSYSFTAVGSGDDDRATLSAPVADRLWLAGEASHPTAHSTVHGAWLSGQVAAEQAST
ncbi:MAG: hypothetical protein EBU54_13955 [Mycobacteriaceae bacterium]|nr:hypothetical protein [Mycobacteriaceae bacterium]